MNAYQFLSHLCNTALVKCRIGRASDSETIALYQSIDQSVEKRNRHWSGHQGHHAEIVYQDPDLITCYLAECLSALPDISWKLTTTFEAILQTERKKNRGSFSNSLTTITIGLYLYMYRSSFCSKLCRIILNFRSLYAVASFWNYFTGIDDIELSTIEIRRTVDTMPFIQREILAALIVHLQRFLIFIVYNQWHRPIDEYALWRHEIKIVGTISSISEWDILAYLCDLIDTYFVRIVYVWNSLPDCIVRSNSVVAFRQKLKLVHFSDFFCNTWNSYCCIHCHYGVYAYSLGLM